MSNPETNYDARLLITNDQIARYCGICVRTLSRWRTIYAFPACNLPDGRVATSTTLIDQWVMARMGTVTRYSCSPGRPKLDKSNKQRVTADTSSKGGSEGAPT